MTRINDLKKLLNRLKREGDISDYTIHEHPDVYYISVKWKATMITGYSIKVLSSIVDYIGIECGRGRTLIVTMLIDKGGEE